VVPAPNRAAKVKGAKGTEQRFAHALSQIMNELAAEGWEYLRTDTLPCEERTGLTRKTSTFQNMLVFRRRVGEAAEAPAEVPAARSEPVLAAPTFRSTATVGEVAPTPSGGTSPALRAVPDEAPDAPRLGAAPDRDSG
jgi:hypothetical protein